jgi:hypothetical protein
MTKMTRRKFLAGAIGGTAVLLALPYAFYHWRSGRPERIVMAILTRRLGFLDVDPASFEQFATEYVEYKKSHAGKLAKLSAVAFPYTYVTLYRWLPMGHPLRRLEDNVVTKYLLSTDFFMHGADEARRVEYLSFYEPHRAPCRNPLANMRRRG